MGKGLCLERTTGNFHPTRRKPDGAEIFTIKKQRWVEARWREKVLVAR